MLNKRLINNNAPSHLKKEAPFARMSVLIQDSDNDWQQCLVLGRAINIVFRLYSSLSPV